MVILIQRASVHASLNPKTENSYNNTLVKYFTFVRAHNLSHSNPSPQWVVAFINYLVAQGIKYPTIANHISVLKYQFIRFNLVAQVLDSPMALRVLRSIDKNVCRPLVQKSVFTVSQLVSLVQLSERQPLAVFLVPLFLLVFFAFLRISNFQNLWDKHFTLLRQDLFLLQVGALL